MLSKLLVQRDISYPQGTNYCGVIDTRAEADRYWISLAAVYGISF